MAGNDPYELVKNREELKEEMMDEYGYLFCQICKRSRGFRNLAFHHIVYRSEAPKHQHLHSKKNLVICCDACHDKMHGDKNTVREDLINDRGLRQLFPTILP